MAYYISSGRISNGITLSNNSMYIYAGGVANSTTVNSWGEMHISSGGVANSTTANSLGDIYVSSGGTANSTTVNSGGVMHISSGGTANTTRVNRTRMNVSSGGVANNTTVYNHGNMYISSGGVANNTTVYNHGNMHISSGGTANSTTVEISGCMYISSGGVADSTTVNYGGTMGVHGGGVANSTTMSGGYMYIYSGGVANDTVVNGAGSIYISSGGVANSTTVNSRGAMHISSGGTANNTVVCGDYYSGCMYISSGGVANSTTVNYLGYMYISSGGVANSTTINSNGYMHISSGGVANRATINSGGSVYISSGGTATNIVWTPCIGYVSAAEGAYVTYAGNHSGVYFGSRNQLLSHTTTMTGKVLSGHSMYVMSGGVANSTTVNSQGSMCISSGGTATDTTMSGGYMYIYSGGVANYTWVNYWGSMYISSGGTANTTRVQDYGLMLISDGGLVSGTVNYGSMWVCDGGTADNTTVTQRGCMNVSSGGTANTTRVQDYGLMLISDGGVANDTTMSGGTMGVHGGGVANRVTVKSGGMYISSGGVANSTTVNPSGYIHLNSGGTANSTTVNFGGYMGVHGGGVVNMIKENGGYVEVEDGANVIFASNTISGLILSCGSMTVHQNTVANSTTVKLSGCIYISSGGVADSTTVNLGGTMGVHGGVANSTTVNSNGYVYISSGGVANSTTVNSGGYMEISSAGVHRGSLQITSGAVVSAYYGSIIDFTVADRSAADGYLINDLSFISGWMTYTITVSATQAEGTYKLAQGAENFTGSITIGDGTINYGSATANEQSVWYNGITYSIKQENGYLTLEIYDITPPEIPTVTLNTYALTNSDLTVTAAFSDDSVVKQYRIGNGEWQNYIEAFTVSENGTIYFRAEDAAGNESTNEFVISNIDKAAPEIPVGFNETISGYNATLDWYNASDTGVSGVNGYYVRYGTSELLTGEGNFITASEFDLTDLAVGTYYYQVKTLDNANNISEWSEIQSFEVKATQVQNLRGNSSGLSWDAISGAQGYIVEYATDNFANVMSFETTTNKVDSIALPVGTYQWRVKAINGENFSTGENIISQHIVAEPQDFVSNADGNTDIFFVNANEKWTSGYAAQHTGILNGWSGTNEQVTLTGKNKLADIFEGSTDANILLMTDDANGDTLFVDDIYTALPGTVAEQQSRIAKIDEIRAGNGDDIVDMTSQRFAYIGDGVKIYGGIGNDTIWANNGSNSLFGDAGNDRIVGGANNDVIVGGIGNDRMHGGGGDDIFTFGNNWGNDTIEQLDGGEITLWFESGEMSNWNADTLTYSDGTNSVKVSGVSNDNITLIFGDDGSLRYDELANSGCFEDATCEKIFEDKNKGMLA